MSTDDLRVMVARVVSDDARHKGWPDCLDRAIALVRNEARRAGYNEAIKAAVDLAQSEQGTTAEMIASAIAALRKPEEWG